MACSRESSRALRMETIGSGDGAPRVGEGVAKRSKANHPWIHLTLNMGSIVTYPGHSEKSLLIKPSDCRVSRCCW